MIAFDDRLGGLSHPARFTFLKLIAVIGTYQLGARHGYRTYFSVGSKPSDSLTQSVPFRGR
jgi:hypothetical protein